MTAPSRKIVAELAELATSMRHDVETLGPGAIAVTFDNRLTSSRLVIVGGRASSIAEEELAAHRPGKIVVEDGVTEAQWKRLRRIAGDAELWVLGRFLDHWWNAEQAARYARDDALAAGDTELPERYRRQGLDEDHPFALYTNQWLDVNGDRKAALTWLTNEWLPDPRKYAVIIAEAGVGKSELMRMAEFQLAQRYLTARTHDLMVPMPPVAIRVPVRNLPKLTVQEIARQLADFGLTSLSSPRMLEAVVRHQRLVLLLDGLDELPGSGWERLAEVKALASAGSTICLTSRPDYFGRAPGIAQEQLGSKAIVCEMHALETEAEQMAFLGRYQTASRMPESAVRQAHDGLGENQQKVPLFLKWALRSLTPDAQGCGPQSLPPIARASDTDFFLELSRCACAREVARLGGLTAEEQMEWLAEVAWEVWRNGRFEPRSAHHLGSGDDPFFTRPHVLLVIDGKGHIKFLDDWFENLFLASAIRAKWRVRAARGDVALRTWLAATLGDRPLEPNKASPASEVLTDGDLRRAWRLSGHDSVRFTACLRGNLFALALARVNREGIGRTSPQARGEELAAILGDRDLRDVRLVATPVEYLDFRGWDLRRTQGPASVVNYCSLDGATTDRTPFDGAAMFQVDAAVRRMSRAETETAGRRVLDRVTAAWQAPELGEGILPGLMQKDQYLPEAAMQVLYDEGWFTLERGEAGDWFWHPTDEAREMMKALLSDSDPSELGLDGTLRRLAVAAYAVPDRRTLAGRLR